MTALSIALVISVAMLCATRLVGRWFDVRQTEASAQLRWVGEWQKAHEHLSRRVEDIRSSHMAVSGRVEVLEAALVNKEVWK